MRSLLPVVLFALLTNAPAKTWLVVSPDPILTEALTPLIAHRALQGLDAVIPSTGVSEAIEALDAPPDYLLIIGDNEIVPAKRGQQYRWRAVQPESFAADPLFSDLDGDGLPNFPVGRIPVKTPEQLAIVVEKIIAYEKRTLGIDDLNLPIWSGTPAYGKLLDESADWLLISSINKYAPKWAQPWVISPNPNNTLNAWPAEQANLFHTQILKGAAFTTMMGHGNTGLFFSMNTKEGDLFYTNETAAALDASGKVTSPLVIFACDCGNFAHKRTPSLAATMLLGRGGPVATIAATTESHPLTNYYSSLGLMAELTSDTPAARGGDLWLSAQLSAQKMRKPIIERMLKNAEGALEAEIDIPKLKRDQTQMYAYLGDPALKLSLPTPLEAEFTRSPDKTWTWTAKKPPGAEKLIVQHRPVKTPQRSKPKDADREQSLKLFADRNALFVFQTIAELPPGGDWTGTVTEPGDLRLISLSKTKFQVATKKLR